MVEERRPPRLRLDVAGRYGVLDCQITFESGEGGVVAVWCDER
jgi:hypothetical protein